MQDPSIAHARILKAPVVSARALATSNKSGAHIIRRERLEAEQAAAQILAAARREAAELIEQTRQECEESRAQSQEAGRRQGEAEALAQALTFHRAEAQSDERSLDRICQLAKALAERLLAQALVLDSDTVASLAKAVLAEAQGARAITLQVCPDDQEVITRALANALGPCKITIEPAADLQSGDVLLQSDIGRIDARLSPRLELLTAALRQELAP